MRYTAIKNFDPKFTRAVNPATHHTTLSHRIWCLFVYTPIVICKAISPSANNFQPLALVPLQSTSSLSGHRTQNHLNSGSLHRDMNTSNISLQLVHDDIYFQNWKPSLITGRLLINRLPLRKMCRKQSELHCKIKAFDSTNCSCIV